METRRRSQVAGGVLLILLGAIFLAFQLVPALRAWVESADWAQGWPLIVVGVGAFLLIFGLAVGAPGMAVPACIVGGIGGLLLWQNASGQWASWAYAWTLIPGFVGVGTLLSGLLGGTLRRDFSGAAWLILISLVMFAIFGSFLGGPQWLGGYWPVLLILLGVILFARALLRR
ncbi:MAG: hypothetical protein AB1449_13465 [Chloroflexota bacterium]